MYTHYRTVALCRRAVSSHDYTKRKNTDMTTNENDYHVEVYNKEELITIVKALLDKLLSDVVLDADSRHQLMVFTSEIFKRYL